MPSASTEASAATATPLAAVRAPSFRAGHFRWVVCGLLFFVTANNYMDRQVFGIMGPELIRHFNWSPTTYTDIVFWFQIAYGIGFLVSGRILDIIGTRLGFAIAVSVWSIAAALHGAMGTILGFKVVRFLLGLSEPSHLPGAIKVVSEWFPRSERALATGIYKAGSNLGAVIVPVLVPWMFVTFGWRSTFLITAATGFIWLAFWLKLYRLPAESPQVSDVERGYILSDPIVPVRSRVPWRALLQHRETWAYMNFKFMTDAIWHWYAAMLPLYLSRNFHLTIKQFGLPLITVYVLSDIGSIGGGWFSSRLIKRGWSITAARKLAMFICCATTLPVLFVTQTHSLWLVVVLVGIAHGSHQGLTANLFTTVSDLYPRNAVGSVIGLGGTAGQIGAALMTALTGMILARTGNFTVLFLVAGSTYLVAWTIFHLVVPRLEPIPGFGVKGSKGQEA